MRKLLIILGSTSTGKTDLALQLAKSFNGELVSCDSRQVYVGLDIGTGKAPGGECKVQSVKCKVFKGKRFWEIDEVKIWMYDVVSPDKQYTVYDYINDATSIIEGIQKKGKLPIIVGGTGFYLRALLKGIPNLAIPIDKKLRNKLEKLSKEELQEKLQKISPDKWQSLNESDRQNPRRLIRAIETISAVNINTTAVGLMSTQPGDVLKIGLTVPRQVLYRRIDERVVNRIDQGMIDEARNLYNEGLTYERMKQLGLEYGVLADYLQGEITSQQELIKILQDKIHQFARRQQTWFKKEKNVNWFDITTFDYPAKIEKLVADWYNQK